MSSPDVSPYIDLTVYDEQSFDIYRRALDEARVLMPEWRPREGTMELLLLQAMALEVAELSATINRLPSAITEILLKLYRLERSTGVRATGDVRFTAVDGGAYVIPTGTQVAYIPPSSIQDPLIQAPLVLATTEEGVTSNVGDFDVIIPARATTIGGTYNGLQDGTPLTPVTLNPYIESIEVANDPISGGSDSETDQQYFDRAMARLSRLTNVLVRKDDFVAYVIDNPEDEFTDVYRAYAFDTTNGTAASAVSVLDGAVDLADMVIPDSPGFVTVAVADIDGIPYDVNIREGIQEALNKHCMVTLEVAVIDATVLEVDLEVTVKKIPIASTSAVGTAVELALVEFINPNTWDWSSRLRYNEAVAVAAGAEGVDYVDTLTFSVVDLDLTDTDFDDIIVNVGYEGKVAPLYSIRNMTVNVT